MRILQHSVSVIAVIVTSGVAHSQPTVGQLLKEVSSACQELYLHGYAVDITRRVAAEPRFQTGSATVQSDRIALPIPNVHAGGNLSVNRIVLARSGKSLRYELVNPASEVWQWTTNGETTWCYRRDLNQYQQDDAEPWPVPLAPSTGLPGTEWKYFAKFLAIGDMADRARLVKDDIGPDKFCAGSSVMLELTLAEGKEPSKEDLRILNGTHLPCYSVLFRMRTSFNFNLPVDVKETITWRFRDRLDPMLFVFAPKEHAKRVTHFPR